MIMIDQYGFAAGHTVSSAALWSISSPQPLHACGTNSLKRLPGCLSATKVPGALVFGLFCLATVAQLEAVSQMRLHTGMSPWKSASGFLLSPWSLIKRAHPHSERRTLSRDEPGGATQAKSAAGARRVKRGEVKWGWRLIDRTFKIKASLGTHVLTGLKNNKNNAQT